MTDYAALIGFLGQSLPSAFELILFDATVRELPVLACANRMTGTHELSRRLVAELLRNKAVRERGMATNLPSQNDLGRMIKSSVYLIKNEKGNVTMALCVNMQCDVFLQMQTLVSSALQFNSAVPEEGGQLPHQTAPLTGEPSLDLIARVLEKNNIEPRQASPNERVDLICEMYDLGVFELKGSVAKAAEALQISEQSVYRYLSKIRKARM